MEIIHIALYTIKRRISNVKILLRMVFFPLLLILIIGVSLNSFYSSTNYSSETIEVHCETNTAFNDFQNFIKSDTAFKNNIFLKRASGKLVEVNKLNKGDISAYIELNNNFSVGTVYVHRLDSYDTSYIKEIVSSYENSKKLDVLNINDKKNVKEIALDLKNKKPKSIDYYSVTMLVLIMFYGAFYGVSLISEDEAKNIEGRIKGLPISEKKYIIGKIIGSVSIVFVQAVLILFISKYVYKANWGNNLPQLLLILALFSFFVINVGTFIQVITRDDSTGRYIINVLTPFFTFISGGYISSKFLSDDINRISILSPSYAVQNIIFKNVYDYSLNYNVYYYELIILSVAMFLTTLILGRRKM